MAAETLIQVKAAEACFWLANSLSEILHCKPNDDEKIRIECFTDNHQSYDSVYYIRPIKDKRSQTEIALLREMIKITKINWIENKYHEIGSIFRRITKYSQNQINRVSLIRYIRYVIKKTYKHKYEYQK